MAHICERKGGCQGCPYYRFDDETGNNSCWYTYDHKGRSKLTDAEYNAISRLTHNTKEDFWMENRSYWTHQQALHKEIYDVTIAEDRETDGRPINICWLNLGYISPSSGCGFFHYTSLKEFELCINNVVHISNKSVTKKEVQDYLWWLESNECIFKKDKSQITQIAEMLTGEPK